ncbi:peptidoglycan bridge formation glycyltransferase FemA/FemB family protein [Alteribacter aurantiacus]|uniref:peptidoglycan bridge formation glycyltransferase FemA/FemB family protein n=1 Tax=Alteribacter aurantiacus TaxID=254410 RepID=UPI0003F79A44|nr:peptidoglycan bridge formation glycyltransferase FemA/FemB family protein [Alteribacter aurantiacus]
MIDIYFEPNYGKLYEKIENGVCDVFRHVSPHGTIHHMFIKRVIPIYINNQTYYDLVSPYGYGGPVIINCDRDHKSELIEDFNINFQKYCEENNIVSEFARFHPIVGNAGDFQSIYRVENIRKTVGTNLHDFEDPITKEFSKSTRKTIRKILNSGVTYRIIESPNNINKFKEIYYSTMDRNDASDYYYFDDNYFDNCLKYFRNHIILVEVLFEDTVIASGFYFVYGEVVHAHLSGTLKGYLHFSPAYIIKHATGEWAIEHGIKLIHYGGGTSNSLDDPLYQFKKKFGKNTEFDFQIGKKVWNTDVYKQLCYKKEIDSDVNFFPAYRYNLSLYKEFNKQ